jgi:hypothetical protein
MRFQFKPCDSSYPPGVNSDRYSLAKSLHYADVDVGCVIEDVELHNAEFEYARHYND